MELTLLAILPELEYFSAKQGGALATWFYHVYSRDNFRENIKVYVICRQSKLNYTKPDSIICSGNYLFNILYRALRNRSIKSLLNPVKLFFKNSYNRKASVLCQSIDSDIIHIHNEFDAVIPIRKSSPIAKIILHMQNDHLIETDDLKRAELACHAADKIAFCSEYIRNNVHKTFPSIDPKKTFVIFNGTEVIQKDARILSKSPTLIFVGRIVPQKGLHILLDAIQVVFEKYPNASLRIVGGVNFGSSEEKDYIRLLKQRSQVWGERVFWVGTVTHDQIMLEFQQADLFVCPSIWNEPLGMVNAEAMACGLPIVAFAKGGIPEIVGDAGILVEETTHEALAKAINQVLGDSELYQTLSQRGLQRVKEKFNWDVIADQWLNELQQL